LLGEAQVVEALQIEPELGAGAEEVSEAEGRVAGGRAGAVQDLGHAVRWYADLPRELGGAHIERVQFFCEVFAGVNGSDWHTVFLNHSREGVGRHPWVRDEASPLKR
jgi:hypothetical protein